MGRADPDDRVEQGQRHAGQIGIRGAPLIRPVQRDVLSRVDGDVDEALGEAVSAGAALEFRRQCVHPLRVPGLREPGVDVLREHHAGGGEVHDADGHPPTVFIQPDGGPGRRRIAAGPGVESEDVRDRHGTGLECEATVLDHRPGRHAGLAETQSVSAEARLEHLDGPGAVPALARGIARFRTDDECGKDVVLREAPVLDAQREDLLEAIEAVPGRVWTGLGRNGQGEQPCDGGAQNQNDTSVPRVWNSTEPKVTYSPIFGERRR